MNLRQKEAWGAKGPQGDGNAPLPNADRTLTLLAEGIAAAMPEVDGADYKALREKVGVIAMRTPDHLPEQDKVQAIREMVREFEVYGKAVETGLRDRTTQWRSVTSLLLNDVLFRIGIPPTKPEAAALINRIPFLTIGDDLKEYHSRLEDFLHPTDARGNARDIGSSLSRTDHSTENLNAAGLRGGGSAIAHLDRVLDGNGRGYVVIFRLSCLGMVLERFGPEAVDDCLMSISAYLTHSLHRDDQIYHWSDSTLLAIMQGRVSEQILSAELTRVAAHNRDITIQVNGRTIMLRVPLEFDIYPISSFRSGEELLKLSPEKQPTR